MTRIPVVFLCVLLQYAQFSSSSIILIEAFSYGSFNNSDYAEAFAIDSKSSSFVTAGFFTDMINVSSDTFSSAGFQDAFFSVFHYNSTNTQYQWSLKIGTAAKDYGKIAAFDSQSNLILGGNAENGSYLDLFIVKYGLDGSNHWNYQFGSLTSNEQVFAVAIDQNDYLYLCGSFLYDEAVFGGFTLPYNASNDWFILKLTPDGDVSLAWREGGAGDENAYGIAVSAMEIIVVGVFTGTFQVSGLQEALVSSSGSSDMLVVSYGFDGSYLWHVQFGSNNYDILSEIALLSGGAILVGGRTQGAVNIGTLLPYSGGDDMILIKIENRTITWGKTWGGIGADNLVGIEATDSGEYYIVAEYQSTFSMDNFTLPDIPPQGNNNVGFLIAKMSANDSVAWATGFPPDISTNSVEKIYPAGMGVDGDIFIFMKFSGNVPLNPENLTEPSIIPFIPGLMDLAVARFGEEKEESQTPEESSLDETVVIAAAVGGTGGGVVLGVVVVAGIFWYRRKKQSTDDDSSSESMKEVEAKTDL